MDIRSETWRLYLPIGTIESERLLYLLEFLGTRSIATFFINVAPHRPPSLEPKTLDKGASDTSNRSITSTDRSHVSEESSYSSNSRRHNASPIDSHSVTNSSAFDKKQPASDPQARRQSAPPANSAENGRRFVQLFLPTLVIGQFVYIQQQSEICFTLLDCHGVGSKLGLLTESKKSLQEQIQRIEERVDPSVQRLMSFIYLTQQDFESDGREDPKGAGRNWNSYQATLERLIKELEYFYNKYLCHRTVTADSDLTLADVYLVAALNRLYKFLFDPNFAKSWLSGVTGWFHKVSRRKDFENAFGRFRPCKVNYTSLLRDVEAVRDGPEPLPARPAPVARIEEVKRRIREVTDRVPPSEALAQIDAVMFQQLSFEGFKSENFHLWRFSYIPLNEDLRGRKGSGKPPDEVSEFFAAFCQEAASVPLDFVLYVVQGARCEGSQGLGGVRRNLEPCKTHFGNYFAGSQLKGLVLTQSPLLPQFIQAYEDKDILEVRYVESDQNAWLENMLQRRGEFGFEKVIDERIY